MFIQAIPNVILYFLWRKKNKLLYEGTYYINKVIWDINNTIKSFSSLKFKYSNNSNS